MPTLNELVADQVLFGAWATRRMADGLRTLSEEEVCRDLGSSFKSIRGTLCHMYGGDMWLHMLVCLERPLYPDWLDRGGEGASMDQILTDYLNLVAGYAAGASRLAAGRDEDFMTQMIQAHGAQLPRWQAILNMVSHGTYHRGQIACQTRQLGHKPPDTDLIHYHFEQAGERWPY